MNPLNTSLNFTPHGKPSASEPEQKKRKHDEGIQDSEKAWGSAKKTTINDCQRIDITDLLNKAEENENCLELRDELNEITHNKPLSISKKIYFTEGCYTFTPLLLASIYNQWDIVKQMLEIDAEPDINAASTSGSYQGRTPLWEAAGDGEWDIVKLMLEKVLNPNVNATPPEGDEDHGKTPLWEAAGDGEWDIVKLMLEKVLNPNVNATPPEGDEDHGKTPLWWAAANDKWDIVKLMLEKVLNPNVNATPPKGDEDHGKTPLWQAAGDKQWDIVKLMLEKVLNLNVNATPSEGDEDHGKTPLWWAAGDGEWNIFLSMLHQDKGANVNTAPSFGPLQGITPFWYAVDLGDNDMVKSIIRQHPEADIAAKPRGGKSVLLNACDKRMDKIVKWLFLLGIKNQGQNFEFPGKGDKSLQTLKSVNDSFARVVETFYDKWSDVEIFPQEIGVKILTHLMAEEHPELDSFPITIIENIFTKKIYEFLELQKMKAKEMIANRSFRKYRERKGPTHKEFSKNNLSWRQIKHLRELIVGCLTKAEKSSGKEIWYTQTLRKKIIKKISNQDHLNKDTIRQAIAEQF